MQTPEPFPITAEDRAKAVAVLMNIVENGTPGDQIDACEVLVQMVAQNQQADSPQWLGNPSAN